MTGAALLIDFGSTYTKLRAVDLSTGRVLAAADGPSTVTTDINIGLDEALGALEVNMDRPADFQHRLASSSAAGGLRMITVGLVRELTAEAARLAALGAGAKLIGAHAYKLSRADARGIAEESPDILLLAGGTDGGNTETLLWNAEKLAGAGLSCPVIVAGNKAIADDACDIFHRAGIDARTCANVMPEFNVLDVEPARAAIRDVFIERIVDAKGIDKAANRVDAVLMPTPAAVMAGARLIAEGTKDMPGLGPLIVIDIGGATTDVHSIMDGAPAADGVVTYGLPEPYAKRTVEGDLGMRHNARSIVETLGIESFSSRFGIAADDIETRLKAIAVDVERLPETNQESAFDLALASAAVDVATRRHAGRIEIKQTVTGPVTVQHGKDLGNAGTIIGTGGVLARGADPATILGAALFDPARPEVLAPKRPAFHLDRSYALFAVGLLADVSPDAALKLAGHILSPLQEVPHGRSPAA